MNSAKPAWWPAAVPYPLSMANPEYRKVGSHGGLALFLAHQKLVKAAEARAAKNAPVAVMAPKTGGLDPSTPEKVAPASPGATPSTSMPVIIGGGGGGGNGGGGGAVSDQMPFVNIGADAGGSGGGGESSAFRVAASIGGIAVVVWLLAREMKRAKRNRGR